MSRDKILEGIGLYLARSGDAVSQLINVTIFLGDNPNESVSGRSFRQSGHWFWGAMMSFIDFAASPFGKNHCRAAWEKGLERAKQYIQQSEV